MDEEAISVRINKGLARITELALELSNTSIGALYTSGGDVTMEVMKKLGVEGIDIKDEIIPLAFYSRFIGGKYPKDMDKFEPGEVSGMCGKTAFEYLAKSVDYAMNNKVKAIATTPLNKESFKSVNVTYIGHTEVLEDLTKKYNPLTIFQVIDLRVFFLSRHVSLRKACDLVTEENMYEFIVRSKEALRQLGIENPKMAVARLNPHCGEHGLFGDEERKIEPAKERARKEGIDVVGSIGADSVFFFELQGKFDAVLSLYHDQGHIATKTVDFLRTISLTNNMPFLRTSVDRGTDFDIAWKNIVNEVSLVEAIRLAGEYAPNFNNR